MSGLEHNRSIDAPSMTNGKSPLSGITCERQAAIGFDYYVDPFCGDYGISQTAEFQLPTDEAKERKIACTVAVRRLRTDLGTKIVGKYLAGIDLGRGWTVSSIEELISLYPSGALEILEQSLQNLEYKTKRLGDSIKIEENSSWLFYSADLAQSDYVNKQLQKLGYISVTGADVDGYWVRIETEGWRKLAEAKQTSSKRLRQAFVAMWFSPQSDIYYRDGIKPAIEGAGWECMRIDATEHNNKICDQIVAEIRKSRFVVADFTGNRGGVYFEAGYAAGLGIPVIWTVHENDLKELHFDTRQYNHIVYKNEKELLEKLTARIGATIL